MYMRKDYGLATNLMKTKCAKGRTTNRKVIARGEEGEGGGGACVQRTQMLIKTNSCNSRIPPLP